MTRTEPTGHPDDLEHRAQIAAVCLDLRQLNYPGRGGLVQVADALGLHRTTIRQWESAANWQVPGLAAYLDHYGVQLTPALYNVPDVDETDLMAVCRHAAVLASGRGDNVAYTRWKTGYVISHMVAVSRTRRRGTADAAAAAGKSFNAAARFADQAGSAPGLLVGTVQAYGRAWTTDRTGATGWVGFTLTDNLGVKLIGPDPLDAAAAAA